MILHTTEVTPLPGYRLFLRFNNGESGEVDLSGEIDGEVFEALRDPAVLLTHVTFPSVTETSPVVAGLPIWKTLN